MLGRVIGNWKFRIDRINRSYSKHLKDIKFKKKKCKYSFF